MAKPGTKSTPTDILALRDSWRAKDPRRAGEPAARRGLPVCPAFIADDELASAEWTSVCEELDLMKILCTSDRMAIAGYCEAAAEFQRLAKAVREEGHVSVTDKGNAIQNPLVGAKNKAAERMLKFAAQFGLTPSARTGIDVDKSGGAVDEDDENFAAG